MDKYASVCVCVCVYMVSVHEHVCDSYGEWLEYMLWCYVHPVLHKTYGLICWFEYVN